ncbi:MAG: NAD-dependent epimerase/dehydratase family protein [Geminicoccaceae bacterium]|nr:NAD-dependent epimerase/dehydratase family protein [Geminicoccaceae bacterium]
MTRVLLTGASSFTGSWIASALAEMGADVMAPLRGPLDDGDVRRTARLRRARAAARVIPDHPTGSSRLLDLVRRSEAFDVVCLHAAEVGDFRRPAYDPYDAFARNMRGIPALLGALGEQGCRTLVVTGTVFEADEGAGDQPRAAMGAYGLAKTLTWQALRYEAEKRGFTVGKVAVANPFGPDEKPGLVSHMMERWIAGEAAVLRQPRLVRDHVPIQALARAHAAFALALTRKRGLHRIAPSGFAETTAAFAERLARAMRPRLGGSCAVVEAAEPPPPGEPRARHATDDVLASMPDGDMERLWDALADGYRPPKSVAVRPGPESRALAHSALR